MSDWQTKLWGRSRTLYVGPEAILAEAEGEADAASSLHLHRGMHNTFQVLQGVVDLYVGDARAQRLAHRQCGTILAGVRHRMVFVTAATLLELYFPVPGQKCDPADIVRFDEGFAPGRFSLGRQPALSR